MKTTIKNLSIPVDPKKATEEMAEKAKILAKKLIDSRKKRPT
ncbi:MAG: hypothetical protein AAB392_01160 [Patescibacteria group bacterium]